MHIIDLLQEFPSWQGSRFARDVTHKVFVFSNAINAPGDFRGGVNVASVFTRRRARVHLGGDGVDRMEARLPAAARPWLTALTPPTPENITRTRAFSGFGVVRSRVRLQRSQIPQRLLHMSAQPEEGAQDVRLPLGKPTDCSFEDTVQMNSISPTPPESPAMISDSDVAG
jgi:hypothetical protein